MAHRSRSLPFTLVAVGLAAVASAARAADDDFEFANALSQRGYPDLAEQQFRKLLSDPNKSAKEKAEGQYGLALIKRFNALMAANETNDRRRKPLPEVLGLFQEADKALEAFIDGNSGHPRLLEAKLDRAKLITDRADYVNRAVANDWVPADVDTQTLMRQVAGGYDTAIGLLKSVEDVVREKRDELDIGSDERAAAEDELGIVWLYRIVALYGKGAALPDSTDGQNSLRQVGDEVVEFAWDFEGTVRGLWAFHYDALTSWRLGDAAKALKGMRETAESVSEADGFAAVRPVALKSYEMLAVMALDMAARGISGAAPPETAPPATPDAGHGGHDRSDEDTTDPVKFAARVLDGMASHWPTHMEDAYGQRAELAHARLMAKLGKAPAAVGRVQEVVKKALEKNTGVDYEAGRVLDELMASGAAAGVRLDPELLKQRALTKWRDEDFDGAIDAYMDLIHACDSPALMETYGWDAWDRIGQCHYNQDRWQKAYDAFDTIEQAWAAERTNAKLSELTDETGWSRLFCIKKMADAEPDPTKKTALATRLKAATEQFAKDHPNSRFNQDADFQAATAKLGDGRRLRRDGDNEAAVAKLQEAIKLLGGIPQTSSAVDKATALIPQAHLEIGRCHQTLKALDKAAASFDTAIKLSRAWLAQDRPAVVDTRVQQNRESGKNIALTNILTAMSGKADVTEDKAAKKQIYADFLKAMDELGADFASAVAGGKTTLDVWKVEALIGVGQVEEAERLVSDLLKKDPDLRNGPYLAALVAAALEKDANEWRKKGDEGKFKAMMVRCARLREYAITKSGDASPQSYVFIAKTWKAAGDFEKAADYLRKALAAYGAAGSEDMARVVRLELIDLLIDQKKFEEAIPQLEALLVADATKRPAILDRLGKDDQITPDELTVLLETMSNEKRVLDILDRAYLEAARDQKDLLRAINLSAILFRGIPKDDYFKAEWYEYTYRLALGYFRFGVLTTNPDALRNVVNLIEHRIKTPGLLESCDEVVPGIRRRFEDLLEEAKSKI